MENQTCEQPSAEDLVGLGMVLGQNQTFGLLAGRCSAAQAETIRRLRVEKIYKRVAEEWKEFCPRYLKMSSAHADHIIRLWEEFGPAYFEVAQLTRVSPETYRAIEPAVQNGFLMLDGEQIELTVENSRRVAAAVAQVRRTLSTKPAADLPIGGRAERLEQLCDALVEEFKAMPDSSAEAFQRYRAVVLNLYAVLKNIRRQFRY